MDEFLRAFTLWDDRHSPLSSYSKGMRQKILLSAALLHGPDVLILDEPFSGLDVTSGLMLRTLLRQLAGRGKIILYSSHVLEVVEKICSTVLILRKGEVVAYDSIERLRELMSQPSLEGVFAQLAAYIGAGDQHDQARHHRKERREERQVLLAQRQEFSAFHQQHAPPFPGAGGIAVLLLHSGQTAPALIGQSPCSCRCFP